MNYAAITLLILVLTLSCTGCTAPSGQTAQTVQFTPVQTSIPSTTQISKTPATPTLQTATRTTVPTTPVYPKPLTGKLISGMKLSGGYGELTIDNTRGGSDAVAVLTKSGRKEPVSGIFIRNGDTFTFNGVVDGIYDLYFILGDNWNPDTKKFTNHPSYQRFTDSFDFATTNREYTTYRVTLYGVVQGNANTNNVGENGFPPL